MRIEEWGGMGSSKLVEVGMKCTIHFYSECCPCEVVNVSKSGKNCYIRRNEVIADPNKENGIGHQNWLFKEGDWMNVWKDGEMKLAEKPDNCTYYRVTKRKNGQWRTSGSDLYVCIGQWEEYFDWSY